MKFSIELTLTDSRFSLHSWTQVRPQPLIRRPKFWAYPNDSRLQDGPYTPKTLTCLQNDLDTRASYCIHGSSSNPSHRLYQPVHPNSSCRWADQSTKNISMLTSLDGLTSTQGSWRFGDATKETNFKEMDTHELSDKESKIAILKKFCEAHNITDTLLHDIRKQHVSKSKQRQKPLKKKKDANRNFNTNL